MPCLNIRHTLLIKIVCIFISFISCEVLAQDWIVVRNQDCKVWNEAPKPNEYALWHGSCTNGIANGLGTVEWYLDEKLSSRREGNYVNGKLEGMGKHQSLTNNVTYEGEFVDGNITKGKIVNADGSYFVGEFNNNKISKGKYIYANGAIYEGEFKNGRFSKGKLIYSDGTYSDGTFDEGKLVKGVSIYKEGAIYDGELKNGKPHGIGSTLFSKGHFHVGEYSEGNRENGFGIMITPKRVYNKNDRSEFGQWIGDFFIEQGEFLKTGLKPINLVSKNQNGEVICTEFALKKFADCNVFLVVKKLMEDPAIYAKQEIENSKNKCINAEIPNVIKTSDMGTDFYGECDGTKKAVTGIVVWKYKNLPINISCLNSKTIASTTKTDQFNGCDIYWSLLPTYCSIGNYHGQCLNGKAHGVGFETSSGSTIFVRTGRFENGQLHGFGVDASVSGCGMAGCSGNRFNDKGWFIQGKKEFDCNAYEECITKLSGKSLALERRSWDGINAKSVDVLRKQNDFNSAIDAYHITGDKNDLKIAQTLAKTSEQKTTLEFTAMQAVGYDKALLVSANIKNGTQSIGMSDANKLLGFYKNVSSQFPVSINWVVKNNKELLPMKFGNYEVTLSIGLQVTKTNRSCLWGFCQDRDDTDRYVKKAVFLISNKNNFKNDGIVELSVSGSETSSMFGVQSGSVIKNIESIITIDSVKLTNFR
jgi:hypothetical protein